MLPQSLSIVIRFTVFSILLYVDFAFTWTILASYCIMTFFGLFGLGARAALSRKGAQFGAVLFGYKRNWIKEVKTREQPTLYLHMGVPWKTVEVSTAFGKDQEAGQIALKKHEGKTIMYNAIGGEWQQFGHARKKRPLESVVLDNDISEILCECREFIDDPYNFVQVNLYCRICLLHGPPGCGKFSYITALAGELERNICVLNLSAKGLTDDRLNHLLAVAPLQTIILLEDIDAVFTSTKDSEEAAYNGFNGVTFRGLLNCLRDVPFTEARILFMTTNYLGTLDSALNYSVDEKVYIGWCSASQVEQMFLRFYKELEKDLGEKDLGKLAKEFADSVMSFEKNVSPAQIQEYFMFHKSDPDAVVKHVAQIWEPRDK